MAPSRKTAAKAKGRAARARSSQLQNRQKSVELGEDVRYNPRTGRPIRDSAGRKSLGAGFLDTTEVVGYGSSSEELSEDDDGQKKKTPRKRKRTPSPPLPPLSPMPREPDEVSSREPTPALSTPGADGQPVTLTFNVPPGFKGPFVVKLDNTIFSKHQTQTTRSPKRQRITRAETPISDASGSVINVEPRHSHASPRNSGKPRPHEKGLDDLPPEIRNKIYRLLFVTKEPIEFDKPTNFCRSSALLRTNKQIYNEGRSVLYSENRFYFSRNHSTRANYWDACLKEIGYKDLRVFLKTVGPTNICLLRSIEILFTDASPSATPRLTNEERRFVHDEHLIDCLRMLSSRAKLKDINLIFGGRKSLVRTEYRFLDALREIKADKVSMNCGSRTYYSHRVDVDVKSALLQSMVREDKLYTHDE